MYYELLRGFRPLYLTENLLLKNSTINILYYMYILVESQITFMFPECVFLKSHYGGGGFNQIN